MLTIEVAAINGAPPPVSVVARFDRGGGTIGRDPSCTLVLPDPEKRVSRRHALVEYRGSTFLLRNQGSAITVLLNGAPLDYGAEAPLAAGDQIEIGEFSLRVSAATAGPGESPVRTAKSDDLPAGFGPSASASDPFADLIPPTPAPGARPPAPAASKAAPSDDAQRRAAGLIPDDFDPFGEPMAAPPTEAPSASGRGDFADLVPARQERVDDLFGLHSSDDPFPPGHPLAAPTASSTPGPAGIDDLLSPAKTEPRKPSSAPVQRDDAPEFNAPMRLPDAVAPTRPASGTVPPPPTPTAAPAVAEQRIAPPAEEGPETKGGMRLSWDERGEVGLFDAQRTVVIGGGTADRRRGDRRKPEPAAAQSAPLPTAPAAERPQLMEALLDGLGMEHWPGERRLDEDAVRRLGRLLRAAVQGTIDLLRARALIKSEVQAQMTMIVTRDNNPLKFSPNAEAALSHLLGPSQRGFMSADAAMQDAYRDLVAHQFGFTAGTRAALADVLKRFDPAQLEARLTDKSALDSWLPARRKAKLWDLFAERFTHLSSEAEDDFQRMFGREFLRAYEAQIAKMKLPERKGDS